jgi:hypothetical protein
MNIETTNPPPYSLDTVFSMDDYELSPSSDGYQTRIPSIDEVYKIPTPSSDSLRETKEPFSDLAMAKYLQNSFRDEHHEENYETDEYYDPNFFMSGNNMEFGIDDVVTSDNIETRHRCSSMPVLERGRSSTVTQVLPKSKMVIPIIPRTRSCSSATTLLAANHKNKSTCLLEAHFSESNEINNNDVVSAPSPIFPIDDRSNNTDMILQDEQEDIFNLGPPLPTNEDDSEFNLGPKSCLSFFQSSPFSMDACLGGSFSHIGPNWLDLSASPICESRLQNIKMHADEGTALVQELLQKAMTAVGDAVGLTKEEDEVSNNEIDC